jgi:hypothetical protein
VVLFASNAAHLPRRAEKERQKTRSREPGLSARLSPAPRLRRLGKITRGRFRNFFFEKMIVFCKLLETSTIFVKIMSVNRGKCNFEQNIVK